MKIAAIQQRATPDKQTNVAEVRGDFAALLTAKSPRVVPLRRVCGVYPRSTRIMLTQRPHFNPPVRPKGSWPPTAASCYRQANAAA